MFEIRERFKLSDKFLEEFKGAQPEWGPLGYITYKRTYARVVEDGSGRTEEWWETLQRVVEGCYTIQLNHCASLKLPWKRDKAQRSAQEMFRLMWDFKFLPPGRGLWMMGSDYIYVRGSAALNNCAFVSTDEIETDFAEPFCFLMDLSMLGVGVAFDTLGAGKVTIQEPVRSASTPTWSRTPRKAGATSSACCSIPTSAAASAPPDRLLQDPSHGRRDQDLRRHRPRPRPAHRVRRQHQQDPRPRAGHQISSTDITDLMNVIGKCVVSGGVRRTAELALGDPDDQEYLKLKDPKLHGDKLTAWRWASNNSVSANVGHGLPAVGMQTAKNGEPGYFWLDAARAYGRIKDGETWADAKVAGTNPCAEQTLESYEICNLVETFPSAPRQL
jgi:ribonucleoside-triphosphate reductase